MINAYFCDASEQRVAIDLVPYSDWYVHIYEKETVTDLVFADCIASARRLFIEYRKDGLANGTNQVWLQPEEFTVKLIRKNVARETGIAGHCDALWSAVWKRAKVEAGQPAGGG